MLEEIKAIKLKELEAKREDCSTKITEIQKPARDMQSKQWYLESELHTGITVRKDFSLIEKLFTKRREYKKFKAQAKRMEELPELISQLEDEIMVEKRRADEELEASGLDDEYLKLGQEIEKLEDSETTLTDMEMTPLEAIAFLESHGIEPVLTEADKVLASHPRDYSSKSSLIGVHKTKYIPTANVIKTAKDARAEFSETVEINGVKYEYSYRSARDTVHMAMNDEVSSHMYGSWEDCKYAILIPFEDIPNEKIARASTVDTFTRGNLEITENSWILCPKDEVQKVKTFNPKAHVLGYDGESVLGYSRPFLTQLGYRGESVGMWSWADEKSTKEFCDLAEREGLKVGAHSFTYFHEDETMLAKINQAVSLAKLLRDNGLVKSKEDFESINEQLIQDYQGFGGILLGLCEKSGMEGDLEPQSVVGNGKQVDIFIEEMSKNGLTISPVYAGVLQNLSKVGMYRYTREKNDEVFTIPENATEEERENVQKLQTTLNSKTYSFDRANDQAFGEFISTAIFDSIVHSRERGIVQKQENIEK